jgi:hypothetical protein
VKTFHCDGCGSLVFFENIKCLKCGDVLGFLPGPTELEAIAANEDGTWRALGANQNGKRFHLCENSRQHGVCNWMIDDGDQNPFCLACRLNIVIPDLSVAGNLERWGKLERAKRRIVYTILRLGLPTEGLPAENRPALRFKFVGDTPDAKVLTGHADGLITINIAEADDDERERRRVNLHEPYRTLTGHLRHEVAHYYWDRLVARSEWLNGFRKFFGDETADYGAALQRYYAQGAPADWQQRHVSAYASAHPWEDWAETWAHYFHILDMVETAESFGVSLRPEHPSAPSMTAQPCNPFDVNTNFDAILENWFPLTFALNSLNRGMGLPDAYPFVLSAAAIQKLRFIHDLTLATRGQK